MRVLVLLCLAAAAYAQEYRSPNGKHVLARREAEKGEELFDAYVWVEPAPGPDPPFSWQRRRTEVDVLDAEPAAVLVSEYGEVVCVDRGAVRWTFRSPLHAAFVDEPRGKVVLVLQTPAILQLDLRTGAEEEADASSVIAGLRLPGMREKAFRAALAIRTEKGVCEAAGRFAADAEQPAAARLRAALVVQRGGGSKVPQAFLDAAVTEKERAEDKAFALAAATGALGTDAMRWLERAGVRADLTEGAVQQLAKLGAAGVPSLVYLTTHGDVKPAGRRRAAEALRGLPKDAVLDATLAEMEDAGAEVGGLLLETALATGADDLHARVQPYERTLLRILDKRTADVGWLADHFRDLPTTEAVQPLLKALAAHRTDPRLAGRIIAALRACTGLDFGVDPAAWMEALGRR